jgi:hypothetical protein
MTLILNDAGLPKPNPTESPWQSSTWIYHCHAPDDVFEPEWDDIDPEHREIMEDRGGIPCEGGGVPGPWCEGNVLSPCPWAKREEIDEDVTAW